MEKQKMSSFSMDIEQTERNKLQAIFPQCFKDGRLDIDMLLNLCGEYIDESYEKYKFEWKGKAECFRIAGSRSTGTLRPAAEESVSFDGTNNLYIEGDNLEVLKLLQKSYFGKIKMIYIDPPYNTGNDFVYNDDFKDPIAHYKQITSQATKSNPESMGRFHTAWLNMMYPRLRLAANLLRDDGVIFISIDDNEVHNLRKVCDEIFGEENFVGCIIIKSNPRGSQSDSKLAGQHEYLMVYAKNLEAADIIGHELTDDMVAEYKYEDVQGKYRLLGLRQRGGFWRRKERPNLFYSIFVNPSNGTISLSKNDALCIEVKPIQPSSGEEGTWRWSIDKLNKDIALLVAQKVKREGQVEWDIFQKDYISSESGIRRTKTKSMWDEKEMNYQNGTTEVKKLLGSGIFDYSKPIQLVKQAIRTIGTTNNDIILDFFSGSATTAHAVMQLNAEDGGNRRFIMVQLPELTDEKSEAHKAGYKNICEIGKERIRRAGAKVLAEWKERQAQATINEEREPAPPDIGFRVLKLDTSNLALWDGTPVASGMAHTLADRFHALTHTIKANRTESDIIFEVMLKMGLPLDAVVSEVKVSSRKCYEVSGNIQGTNEDSKLLICLDKYITPDDITAMCDAMPKLLVTAEEAFEDDSALSNAYYILGQRDVEIKLL